MADDSNVVVIPRRRDTRYFDMEPEIHDLVRVVDLALHAFLSELEEPITDDGSVLQILLEDIQQRAKKLRSRYRSDDTAT